LIVLVPYFLFQIGFVYEIAGADSYSIPLSKYRMPPSRLYGDFGYTDDYNVFGARWMSGSTNMANSVVYGDLPSFNYLLTTYCLSVRGVLLSNAILLSNITVIENNGVVYLSTLNVVNEIFSSSYYSWNTTELSFALDNLSLVYSNGGCAVYQNNS